MCHFSFTKNVRRASQILQDDDPMDKAVYWVEHVIKFGGGYRRAMVLDINFVEYYLLDVYALFICVIAVTVLIVYFGCSRCGRLTKAIIGIQDKSEQRLIELFEKVYI